MGVLHTQCCRSSNGCRLGGAQVSEIGFFQVTVDNINERPTAISLECSVAMETAGECISATFELDAANLL